MSEIALLLTALLFGGMTLFSFGFAASLFHVFDTDTARKGLRGTFPLYYLFVIVCAAAACMPGFVISVPAGITLLVIAVSTAFARQVLMPRINAATDSGATGAFKRLHGGSVVLQLVQIVAAGWALTAVA